jgi:hypothetical protein
MVKDELNKHRYMDIKNSDWIRLYISRIMGCFFPVFCFRKKAIFERLYDRGQERIEKELDIVKIIKSIRNIKILMKNSFMDDEIRY